MHLAPAVARERAIFLLQTSNEGYDALQPNHANVYQSDEPTARTESQPMDIQSIWPSLSNQTMHRALDLDWFHLAVVLGVKA